MGVFLKQEVRLVKTKRLTSRERERERDFFGRRLFNCPGKKFEVIIVNVSFLFKIFASLFLCFCSRIFFDFFGKCFMFEFFE